MIIYKKVSEYVDSCQTYKQKIAALDACLDALLTAVLKQVENGEDVSQYSLNDGQVIIQTSYRSSRQVMESYQAIETVRQMYVNRLNGRVVRLRDQRNFI